MSSSMSQFAEKLPVPESSRHLVSYARIDDLKFPAVLEPLSTEVDLKIWLSENLQFIEELLVASGAILFRGFGCNSSSEFEQIIRSAGRPGFEYSYRSTPRKQVEGLIFSSTEYPATQTIPQHNEMSYTSQWPMRLWFCSLLTAEKGGETPLSDSSAVWQRIPAAIRDEFRSRGVRYVRNYGNGLDLPWQEVFQTDVPSDVEAYCEQAGIEWEWKGEGRLRTAQTCQSEVLHPVTGNPVWFNQAHLFHISSLPEQIRTMLAEILPEDEWPRNTYFGDGSQIPLDMLKEIRSALDAETISFSWRTGDVLLCDNLLVAHGRFPFEGPRKVVVGMTS